MEVKRRQQIVDKAALLLGSLLLTLAIVEAGFRVLGIEAQYVPERRDELIPLDGQPAQPLPHGLAANAIYRSTYASDPRGYFGEGHRIDHLLNAEGWRGAEHELGKTPNTFRVLGLGDSYLFGTGVRFEDTVGAQLEAGLTKMMPGRGVEVINTAVSGYNTRQERDLLVNRGLAYDPDLVILYFVPNDLEPSRSDTAGDIDFYTNYTAIYMRPDGLSRYSRAWGWARQRFLVAYRARNYIRAMLDDFRDDSEKWVRTRAALDDIRRICRTQKIPLLVVIFPFFHELDGDYPFQPIHDLVREHSLAAGIPVLDLRETYRDYSGPELWVHPTDQHPNEIAHGVAAEAILSRLMDQPTGFGLPR